MKRVLHPKIINKYEQFYEEITIDKNIADLNRKEVSDLLARTIIEHGFDHILVFKDCNIYLPEFEVRELESDYCYIHSVGEQDFEPDEIYRRWYVKGFNFFEVDTLRFLYNLCLED